MEGNIILFRNDDINPNTDSVNTERCYQVIRNTIRSVEIISGITIFGKTSHSGSVYPEVPFKDKAKEWFYNVNKQVDDLDYSFYCSCSTIASHGLLHVDHSQLSEDAQEMSIVTSCRLLGTNLFIAPFNRFDERTERVCDRNAIKLVTKYGDWRNIEYDTFDPSYKLWYFHSWRWTPERLKEKLSVDAKHTK